MEAGHEMHCNQWQKMLGGNFGYFWLIESEDKPDKAHCIWIDFAFARLHAPWQWLVVSLLKSSRAVHPKWGPVVASIPCFWDKLRERSLVRVAAFHSP
jgi:hypothetical protein